MGDKTGTVSGVSPVTLVILLVIVWLISFIIAYVICAAFQVNMNDPRDRNDWIALFLLIPILLLIITVVIWACANQDSSFTVA